MKNNGFFKTAAVLLAALVLLGGFSVTAFAGGGDVSDEPPSSLWATTYKAAQ